MVVELVFQGLEEEKDCSVGVHATYKRPRREHARVLKQSDNRFVVGPKNFASELFHLQFSVLFVAIDSGILIVTTAISSGRAGPTLLVSV